MKTHSLFSWLRLYQKSKIKNYQLLNNYKDLKINNYKDLKKFIFISLLLHSENLLIYTTNKDINFCG